MKKSIFILIILASVIHSQDSEKSSLKDKILIGGDIGATFTSSDYDDIGVGFMIRGVGEYYFYENSKHKIGIRGFGGYGVSSGSDKRRKPNKFSTQLYTLAVGGIYSFQLFDAVSPYFFAGVKYLLFNPQDENGNNLPNNRAKAYDRNVFNLVFEFGLRYRLSDELYGYSSLTPLSFSDDNIDDRTSGTKGDLVVALNFGLLYKFTAPWVNDELNVVKEDELPKGIEKIDKEIDVKPSEIKEEIKPQVNLETESELKTEMEPEVETGTRTKTEVETSTSNIVEELSHKLDFSKVNFGFGKTELDRVEYVELDRLLNIIEKDSKSKWKIVGYTDNLEPVQVHQSIAIQRAYFVLRYFMSKGIDRDRFEIIVKGNENPIGDNSTEDGRAKNRRVEILKMN